MAISNYFRTAKYEFTDSGKGLGSANISLRKTFDKKGLTNYARLNNAQLRKKGLIRQVDMRTKRVTYVKIEGGEL